ncbi:MAG: PIN domain-containing protein, partial [Burkholderiaceae bacterium]
MSRFPETIVLDTCVLISNVLRRAFLHLGAQGCFQLAWSPVIGDEWRRNAARLWGVSAEDVQEQWDALQIAFPLADQGDVS